MPTPGFIPAGAEFYATIRDEEELVLQDEHETSIPFPSAAAATLYAKNEIERRRVAALPPPAPPDPSMTMLKDWKQEKADELRRAREQFDMRGIVVEKKKRRAIR